MSIIEIPSINEFPKLAGIYRFTNKVNGKIYIGETMNFKHRMYAHVSKVSNQNWTAVISRAFRKYGFSNFRYEILESYPLDSVSKDFLIEREAFYIKEFDAMNVKVGYNRCPYGANTIGYKFSEESKKKMSLAKLGRKHSPEQIAKRKANYKKENHYFYGQKLSQKQKNDMLRGRIKVGVTMSERKNKSKSHINSEIKKRTRICQLNHDTLELLCVWRSASDAARFFNKQSCSDLVRAAKNTNTRSAYGFKWRIATDDDLSKNELKTFYKDGFQYKKQTRYKRRFLKDKSQL